jgi:hypothetical protein
MMKAPGPYRQALRRYWRDEGVRDKSQLRQNLAVALVFGVAALSLDRLLVRTVLVGYLLYAVPHLVFHSTHLAGFGTYAATVLTALQAIVALLPLGLLALTRTTRPSPPRR